MAAPETRAHLGRFEGIAGTVELSRAALAIAEDAVVRGPVQAGFVEVDGERAYFKISALRGRSSLRHALKRSLLRAPLPRIREYGNLLWLRGHGILAPEPLAAGAWWRSGLPRSQFLFTREVPRARTLEAFLAGRDGDVSREAILDELARETAGMHALGFVHHDLHPRNVLVAPPTASQDGRRVWFLDCWAGGPRPQFRGPAYDLACLAPDAPGALRDEERRRLLETYAAERAARGWAIDLERFLRAVSKERSALARKS